MEHAGDGFHTRPTGHCSNLRRTSHFDVARQPSIQQGDMDDSKCSDSI